MMCNKSFNRDHDIKKQSTMSVYLEDEFLKENKKVIYKRWMKIDWLKIAPSGAAIMFHRKPLFGQRLWQGTHGELATHTDLTLLLLL